MTPQATQGGTEVTADTDAWLGFYGGDTHQDPALVDAKWSKAHLSGGTLALQAAFRIACHIIEGSGRKLADFEKSYSDRPWDTPNSLERVYLLVGCNLFHGSSVQLGLCINSRGAVCINI